MSQPETNTGFQQWAILELMGHRRLAGLVSEVEIFGSKMCRVDVYHGQAQEAMTTQFYGGSAIYCMTPITEEVARQFTINNKPQPIAVWDLPKPVREAITQARSE
jgi:hypothetical protein